MVKWNRLVVLIWQWVMLLIFIVYYGLVFVLYGGYMDNSKYIGCELDISIDRPFGSKHPKHGFIYPVNYGYVPGTVSGDGEELDAYLLGVFEPVLEYHGKCIAIIHRTNDDDDKLVITKDKEYTNDQIDALTEFQEQYFEHVIIRENWQK